MRNYTLSAVCVLFLAGMGMAADAPRKEESCGNLFKEDKTWWLLWTHGTVTVTGSPAEERSEKDRELGHYIVQVRKWNSEQVAGLWWKGWRPNKVAAQYQKAAAELDEAISYWNGMSPDYKKYAAKTAATYRQISELLTLSDNTDRTVMADKAGALLAKLEEAEVTATGGSQSSVFERYALVCKK